MTADEYDKYRVPGLVRGLKVLEVFNQQKIALTVTALSDFTGMNRSSCFRIVHTLVEEGYLRQVGSDNTYLLTAKVLELGFDYLASIDGLDSAREVLVRLRNETGYACQLLQLNKKEMVVIACYEALGPYTSRVNVGSRLPAYASRSGQLALGGLSNKEICLLFDQYDFHPYTELTPRNIDELLTEVERLRTFSSATAWGYLSPHMAAHGASVRCRYSGNIVAVVAVSTPIGSLKEDVFFSQVDKAVCEAADEVGSLLTAAVL